VTGLLPGDVLAVRSPGRPAWWIRIGAALRDQPNLSNHIAVAHHLDASGTLWGIEGRPGGVGWVDCSLYLTSPYTLTNAGQPKTSAQRESVCATMQALLGTAYDWEAIVADGMADLGMKVPGWDPSWHGTVPAHVVCSSSAAYAYAKAGLACPAGDRLCQPADWDAFILARAWALPPIKESAE
jgi:hypothetical protein